MTAIVKFKPTRSLRVTQDTQWTVVLYNDAACVRGA